MIIDDEERDGLGDALDTSDEVQITGGEPGEGEAGAEGERHDTDDTFSITFEGEEPEDDEAAPAWAKDLRLRHRQMAKENAELRGRVAHQEQPKPIEVGPEPTMEDEDVDWDQDKFREKYRLWTARSAEAERLKSDTQKAQEEAKRQWEGELAAYQEKKRAIPVQDFDDAESMATSKLNTIQQSIIVKSADDPAKVIYALGKHPGKLDELAKITDPLKFAKAAWKLEGQLKVMKKRAPAPDTPVRGSAQISVKADKEEERLEKEALKTGDMTALLKHRREKRKQAAA